MPIERTEDFEPNLQEEVLNLKCSTALKAHFYELSSVPTADEMIGFWSKLPSEQFPELRLLAQRCICRFGSTYRCEQAFSAMKLIKTRNRARLTADNLESQMILTTSEIEPDIIKLASEHRAHISH